MPVVLYVWKGNYPWDVRAEKVCKALIKAGHEVFMLARWDNGQPERELIDGINIIRVGYNTARKLTQPLSINPIWHGAIKKAIIELNPAIIIPREIMLAEACGRLGRRYDIPVVMDMAEHYPAAMREWKKYYKSLSLRILVHHLKIPEIVEERSVRLADGIITVCHEQAGRLKRQYDFNRQNTAVVHNTPPTGQFDEIRKGTSNPPVILGHHGHLTAEKSVENLIKAFILIADKCPNLKLLLAGGGECADELKEIAEASDCSDRIMFTGVYKPESLGDIIGKIDIGVIPYQVSDFNNYTIHNKIFDYMAAGKPVIVSKAMPMARIIEETGAGIIADCSSPESLAGTILNINNYRLNEMSENGITAFGNKYNWDVDAENLVNFVNRFI